MSEKISEIKEKVFFDLGVDTWHGYATESVWAKPLSEKSFRILNSPFFAKGVSYGDVVFVRKKAGLYFYDSTERASGNSTYRVIFTVDVESPKAQNMWLKLQALGCSYEENHKLDRPLWSVNVPRKIEINEVYDLLERGEAEQIWSFEEGHYAAEMS